MGSSVRSKRKPSQAISSIVSWPTCSSLVPLVTCQDHSGSAWRYWFVSSAHPDTGHSFAQLSRLLFGLLITSLTLRSIQVRSITVTASSSNNKTRRLTTIDPFSILNQFPALDVMMDHDEPFADRISYGRWLQDRHDGAQACKRQSMHIETPVLLNGGTPKYVARRLVLTGRADRVVNLP